jgi:hypothetical protein
MRELFLTGGLSRPTVTPHLLLRLHPLALGQPIQGVAYAVSLQMTLRFHGLDFWRCVDQGAGG